MVKSDMIIESSAENRRDEVATKKETYLAPKLTVVGTVHDLTLGIGNEGAPDGPFNTQGGG